MSKQSKSPQRNSFIFNVEVLIEGKSNAEALEQLIHALNQSSVIDYRIKSGITLGQQIDERKAQSNTQTEIQIPSTDTAKENEEASLPPMKAAKNGIQALTVYGKMRSAMKDNILIRLIVNKGNGNKLSIPCRIIHLNEDDGHVTIYHVDEKKVYGFSLNEIEDYST